MKSSYLWLHKCNNSQVVIVPFAKLYKNYHAMRVYKSLGYCNKPTKGDQYLYPKYTMNHMVFFRQAANRVNGTECKRVAVFIGSRWWCIPLTVHFLSEFHLPWSYCSVTNVYDISHLSSNRKTTCFSKVHKLQVVSTRFNFQRVNSCV